VRKSAIATLTAAILLTVTVLRVLDQVEWRRQTLRGGEDRATNLALIVSEYLRESFASGDSALRQLAVHSRRVGGPTAPEEDWGPSLASARAGIRSIGSISVTDADGVIRHSTQPRFVGQSKHADALFVQLSSHASDDLMVDTPFVSVLEPKQYLLPIGRRLTADDGQFKGIVFATFQPSLPSAFLRTVDVGTRGHLFVFHPNGAVFFRAPSVTAPAGSATSDDQLFPAAKRIASGSSVETITASDGRLTIIGSHATTAPPLITAVALDRNDVLQEFRRQILGALLFFLVVTATLGLVLTILFRQMDAKATAEQAARAAQDDFLMTLSHELRTPLTAIHGWSRMLLDGQVQEDRRRAALESIVRNAQVQARLVDDLLDMSHVTGGQLRLHLQAVDPGEVVRAAANTVAPAAQTKNIQLTVSLDSAIPAIIADRDRLHQIVWNLLSNAVKFTDVGGTVIVHVGREGDELTIRVSDDGSGISPAFLPHVFERFRQQHTGPTRPHGGLGLGLAIVRHLTELHGGSVRAESAGEGQGASFIVRLPIARLSEIGGLG